MEGRIRKRPNRYMVAENSRSYKKNTMTCSDASKRQDTTARKASHKEQFWAISAAEIALQQDWGDEKACRALSSAQQTLHEMQMAQQDKWKTELDIKWNTVGDTCSREFFEFHSPHRARKHIKEIRVNGTTTRDPQEIKRAMTDFYSGLYKNDVAVEANSIAREHYLQSVPTIITED